MFRLSVNLALSLAILTGPGMCCCTAALFAPAAKPVAAAEPECRHCCCPPVDVPPCCRHESKQEKRSPKPSCCECCIKPQLAPVAAFAEVEKPEPALIGLLPRPASDALQVTVSTETSRPPPHLSMKRFIEDFCHILRC